MKELNKLTPWAESGTKTPVPYAKTITGWLNGEQPPFEYENHRRFTTDSMTNEIIDRLNRISKPERDLIPNPSTMELGLDIGFPDSYGNVIEPDTGYLIAGSTAAVVDDVPFIFTLEHSDSVTQSSAKVRKHNLETGVVETIYTNTQVDADLRGLAIACNGEFLFVLQRWYVAGSGTWVFNLISLFLSDGVPSGDWTEPALGYHAAGSTLFHSYILKVLPSGNLFVGGNWGGAGAFNTYIIDAVSGAILVMGNPGMSGTLYPCGDSIAFADGTIIFSTVDSASGVRKIVGCLEADLSLVTGYPLTMSPASATYKDPPKLFRIDSERWGWFQNIEGGATAPTVSILVKNLSSQVDDYLTTAAQLNTGTTSKVGKVWFDGSYLWFVAYLASWKGGSPAGVALVRLNLSSLPIWLGSTTTGITLLTYLSGNDVFFLNHESLLAAPNTLPSGLTFDGTDIWAEVDAGEGKKLFRVRQ